MKPLCKKDKLFDLFSSSATSFFCCIASPKLVWHFSYLSAYLPIHHSVCTSVCLSVKVWLRNSSYQLQRCRFNPTGYFLHISLKMHLFQWTCSYEIVACICQILLYPPFVCLILNNFDMPRPFWTLLKQGTHWGAHQVSSEMRIYSPVVRQ